MRRFSDLCERDVLALAIALEEEHARLYADYAAVADPIDPAAAAAFREMGAEEDQHRRSLITLYRQQFGEHIPLIRPQDIAGFLRHDAVWTDRPVDLGALKAKADAIEQETARFYRSAAGTVTDAGLRSLLGDLAAAEDRHSAKARRAGDQGAANGVDDEHRAFVLQYIQPGLTGLIDGSISTLAPIFAAAFATQSTWATFLVGMAASIGAGISMGIAEAMSDDGMISGRGHPWMRGTITGLMTTLGGLGHTLPYLIPDFWTATGIAAFVVVIELWLIAWVRARYMDTRFWRAAFEVVVGGAIVFAVGVVIGSA